ncbi:MAG: hypothetical protein KC561_18980, partial [Myxococcales bacterium]|nr:hypothetical protein [Myxococcales bacterium]
LVLMAFTFFLISFLIFIVINLAPGRAGQTQLSGGQGESVRDSAGAREGYLLFKLQYGLNLPMLWNTRYDLEDEEVVSAVETIAQNLTATVPGERQALMVARTTGNVLSRISYPEYWAIADRLANDDLTAEERAALQEEQQDLPRDLIDNIRPNRPNPGDLVDAQENLENWGMYAVPALYQVAREHRSAKVRWQAIEYLTLNAQDRQVDPETGAIVQHHPERAARRILTGDRPNLPGYRILYDYGRSQLLADIPDGATANRYIQSQLPRTDVETWTYELNAPQEEIDETLALWETWYNRNAYRFEYSSGERFRIALFETRLARYWGRLLKLDFGVSSQHHRPVVELLFEKWKYSIYLSLLAVFFAYFLSVPIGLYSAVKRGGVFDRGVGLMLFLLYSLPSFFIATLLQDFLTEARSADEVLHVIKICAIVGLAGILPVFVGWTRYRQLKAEEFFSGKNKSLVP